MVVSTSAINCLERLVSEMTCYASSGMLNPTHHSLTHSRESNENCVVEKNWDFEPLCEHICPCGADYCCCVMTIYVSRITGFQFLVLSFLIFIKYLIMTNIFGADHIISCE